MSRLYQDRDRRRTTDAGRWPMQSSAGMSFRFGFPSSVATAASGTASPTLAVRLLGPSTFKAGALLPTISGVVLKPPPVPMFDMIDVSSST